eukprot:1856100-Amphidinium_carterae.1
MGATVPGHRLANHCRAGSVASLEECKIESPWHPPNTIESPWHPPNKTGVPCGCHVLWRH